jgi:hypothetical protein
MDLMSLIAIISLLIGLILLIWAWLTSSKKKKFFDTAIRAEGKVVALIKRESDETSTNTTADDEVITDFEKVTKGFLYAPKIEYLSSSGEKYVIEAMTFSYPPKHKIGDQLILYYDPNHPEKGIVDTFMKKWLTVIMLAIFGTIFFLFGLILQLAA